MKHSASVYKQELQGVHDRLAQLETEHHENLAQQAADMQCLESEHFKALARLESLQSAQLGSAKNQKPSAEFKELQATLQQKQAAIEQLQRELDLTKQQQQQQLSKAMDSPSKVQATLASSQRFARQAAVIQQQELQIDELLKKTAGTGSLNNDNPQQILYDRIEGLNISNELLREEISQLQQGLSEADQRVAQRDSQATLLHQQLQQSKTAEMEARRALSLRSIELETQQRQIVALQQSHAQQEEQSKAHLQQIQQDYAAQVRDLVPLSETAKLTAENQQICEQLQTALSEADSAAQRALTAETLLQQSQEEVGEQQIVIQNLQNDLRLVYKKHKKDINDLADKFQHKDYKARYQAALKDKLVAEEQLQTLRATYSSLKDWFKVQSETAQSFLDASATLDRQQRSVESLLKHRDDLQSLQSTIAQLQDDVIQFKVANNELQGRLSDADSEIKQLLVDRKERDQLSTELALLQTDLQSQQQEIGQLQQTVNQMDNELHSAAQHRQSLEQQTIGLQSHLQQATDDNARLAGQLLKTQHEADLLEASFASKEAAMQKTMHNQMSSLNQGHRSRQLLLDQLQSAIDKIAELQAQLTVMGRNGADQRRRILKLEKVQQFLSLERNEAFDQLTSSQRLLETESERFATALAAKNCENDGLSDQLSHSKQHISDLSGRLESAEADAHKKQTEISQLQDSLTSSLEQKTQLEKQLLCAQGTLDQVQKQFSGHLSEAASEKQDLASSNDSLNRSVIDLQNQLDAACRSVDHLKDALQLAEQEKEQTVTHLQQQFDDAAKRLEGCTVEIEALQQQLGNLQQAADSLRGNNEQLHQQLTLQQADMQQQQEALVSGQQATHRLEQQLVAETHKVVALEEQVSTLESQTVTQKDRLQKLQSRVEKYKTLVHQLNGQMESLQEQVVQQNQFVQSQQQSYEQIIKQKNDEIEGTLVDLHRAQYDQETNLEFAQRASKKMETAIKQLCLTVKKLDAEKHLLIRQLEASFAMTKQQFDEKSVGQMMDHNATLQRQVLTLGLQSEAVSQELAALQKHLEQKDEMLGSAVERYEHRMMLMENAIVKLRRQLRDLTELVGFAKDSIQQSVSSQSFPGELPNVLLLLSDHLDSAIVSREEGASNSHPATNEGEVLSEA